MLSREPFPTTHALHHGSTKHTFGHVSASPCGGSAWTWRRHAAPHPGPQQGSRKPICPPQSSWGSRMSPPGPRPTAAQDPLGTGPVLGPVTWPLFPILVHVGRLEGSQPELGPHKLSSKGEPHLGWSGRKARVGPAPPNAAVTLEELLADRARASAALASPASRRPGI